MGQKSWTPGDKPVMSVCYVHISTIKGKDQKHQSKAKGMKHSFYKKIKCGLVTIVTVSRQQLFKLKVLLMCNFFMPPQ